MDTKNAAYLLNGFFINDLDPATGADRNEIWMNAEIAVGAALSFGGLATFGVEGGIGAEINFNFNDPDRDGKVRFSEMSSNLIANSYNPMAVFDVSGLIDFFLRAYLEIDLFLFSFKEEFEFLRITLFEFDIPFEPAWCPRQRQWRYFDPQYRSQRRRPAAGQHQRW
jgi:hypothetical protein